MGVESTTDQMGTDTEPPTAFDRTIDWVVGAVLGIAGVVVALGGTALYYGATRPRVADIVADAEFQSEMLTEAEAIDTLVALGQWTGMGLVVTGALVVLFGIAVVVVHGRARRANRRTPPWILGIVGALVGSVLSFIPLSPAFGGATAAYLDPNHDANGLGTGALAGLFAFLPVLAISVFAAVGAFVGAPADATVAVVAVLGIVVVIAALYYVGVSAVGGYIGMKFRDD